MIPQKSKRCDQNSSQCSNLINYLPSSLISDMSMINDPEQGNPVKTYVFDNAEDNDKSEVDLFYEEKAFNNKHLMCPRRQYNSSTDVMMNRDSFSYNMPAFSPQQDMFVMGGMNPMMQAYNMGLAQNCNYQMYSPNIVPNMCNYPNYTIRNNCQQMPFPIGFVPVKPRSSFDMGNSHMNQNLQGINSPFGLSNKSSTKLASSVHNSSFGTDSPTFSLEDNIYDENLSIDNACTSMNTKLSIAKRKNNSSGNVIQARKKKDDTGNNISKKSSLFGGKNAEKKSEESDEFFLSFLENLKCEVGDYICSQKGSRVMQKNLNRITPENVTFLINKLGMGISKVMIDIYGNYFCQKLIQTSSAEQRLLILSYIKQDMPLIAMNSSGTHVLQVILDIINLKDEANVILNSIEGKEINLSYDNNATHVIQKILVTIEEIKRENLSNVLISNMTSLCLDCNGICVVKKLISSNKSDELRRRILEEIQNHCLEIVQSPYGNYAIQAIFEEWGIIYCNNIFAIINQNIVSLSMQKYSSNVVEKIMELSTAETRSSLAIELFNPGKLMGLLKNKYGKYVLHKAVKLLDSNQRDELKKLLSCKINVTSAKEKSRLSSFLDLM